jgi:putative glutamine amidotransferase
MRPKIGITLDWQEKGSFSKRPHHALRDSYFQVIEKAGGLPIGIPQLHSGIDEYLKTIEGIVVPGGFFASPSDWYVGENSKSPYEHSPRLQFDLDIITAALAKGLPLLGICAGMQLMGGLKGCKMTNDINKYLNSTVDHLNEKPAEEVAHNVKVTPGTLLESIVGVSEFGVNTAHREAIVTVADGVIINAVAPDGAIEGIELPAYKFALGVQWHPEFFHQENNPSFKLFKALISEAGKHS